MTASLKSDPVTVVDAPHSVHTNRYEVYGLAVESELALPELAATGRTEVDARVSFGPVPTALDPVMVEASWCQANRREFLFEIAGVARYHVVDGRQITIELSPASQAAVPEADVRLWLLGSAFGALLHQRGLMPLHVSAVKAPSGVWAFTGESGEGKSTLAGFLHSRFGWPLVSDDVSVVDADSDHPIIHPGPRKLKLWADALEQLQFGACNSVRDLSNTDKFQLYLPGDSGYQPEALHALVVLETVPDELGISVEALKGMAAFSAVLASVYRPSMEAWFKLPRQRMQALDRLCQSIRVYRFRRPRSLAALETHAQPLLDLILAKER